MIARGVPNALRGQVWRALLLQALDRSGDGALRAALEDDQYYATLLRRRGRGTHAEVRRLINTDAKRTFGGHRHARRLQVTAL